MNELATARPGGDGPVEAPEWAPAVDARLTAAGTWMFLLADVFYFAAFFFAFAYLRSMNNNTSWLPPGTTKPTLGIGAAIVLLMLVAAGAYFAAVRDLAPARGLLWLTLIAGVAAIGLQVYEFGHLGWDPQQGGGYPSVFVGIKGSLTVQLAVALLWLVSHIAQSGPAGDFGVRRTTARSFGNILIFLAGVSLLAFITLYFLL